MKRTRSLFPFAVLLLIVLYINGPNCYYYFLGKDDLKWIENSAYNPVTGIQWALSGKHFIGYRPATALTYTLDYFIWKWNPFGYHLTNVFLHIICVWVIYWIGLILFKSFHFPSLASFTSAFIFAIHPSTYDVVPFISRRADIITGIFMLLSIGIIIKGLESNIPQLRTSLMLFILVLIACFFKETSMLIPTFPICTMALFFEGKNRNNFVKKTLLFFLSSMAGVIIYTLIRQFMGKSYFAIASRSRHLNSLMKLLCNHFGNLLFPCFWQIESWVGIIFTFILLGIPLLLVLIGLIILFFCDRSLCGKVLMLAGILFVLALPYWDTINWVRRYLYQGSAFFSLFISLLLFMPQKGGIIQKYTYKAMRAGTLIILFFILCASPFIRKYTYLEFASDTAKSFIKPLISYAKNNINNNINIAVINGPFSGYALAPYEKIIIADEKGWGKYGRRKDGPVHYFNLPLFLKTANIRHIPDFRVISTLRYNENRKIKIRLISFKNGEAIIKILSGDAECRNEPYTLSNNISKIDCGKEEGRCFDIKWDKTKTSDRIIWYFFDGERGKIIDLKKASLGSKTFIGR